jgi:NADPH:quinone reductase-like Zn-dependent oxidoreductase
LAGVRPDRAQRQAKSSQNLSFGEAAAVPISGITAHQAVRDHGAVEDGQNVLFIGASGGVGSFAVQITKAIGADVTGVCSTAKVDLVRALGTDHVIDYSREDFADGQHRYDP